MYLAFRGIYRTLELDFEYIREMAVHQDCLEKIYRMFYRPAARLIVKNLSDTPDLYLNIALI